MPTSQLGRIEHVHDESNGAVGGAMDETQTASILINLVDGTRQPVPISVKWSAAIHDGRPPDQWRIVSVDGPA